MYWCCSERNSAVTAHTHVTCHRISKKHVHVLIHEFFKVVLFTKILILLFFPHSLMLVSFHTPESWQCVDWWNYIFMCNIIVDIEHSITGFKQNRSSRCWTRSCCAGDRRGLCTKMKDSMSNGCVAYIDACNFTGCGMLEKRIVFYVIKVGS